MESIFFHYYHSPIGIMELQTTDDVLVSLNFLQTERHGVRPQQTNISTDIPSIVIETCAQLDEYFAGKRTVFELKLGQKGTEFQQRVWDSLAHIPFGTTTSYLKQSRILGDEKAIRAVGTANGRNQIGIIVPCHRVIGSDGSLTGYAGDLWRKKWLLELEGAIKKETVLTLF
jgi:methylated-DNA-[protein]-cysteine S-methyltransferase